MRDFSTLLDGPPPRLPAIIDTASERWWRSRPRTRAVIVCAALAGLALVTLVKLLASPYGPPTDVLTAARDLQVGEVIAPHDLERTRWPAALVPEGAIDPPGAELAGRELSASVPSGAVLTSSHVRDGGLAALLADGRAAIAVDRQLLAELPAGSRIDIVGREADGRPVVLSRDAIVLVHRSETVWLDVDANDAPAVAAAAAAGVATPVLRG